MRRQIFLCLLLYTWSLLSVNAQQLLWEQGGVHPGSTEDGLDALVLTPGGQMLATGVTREINSPGGNCAGRYFQALYQIWQLSGTLDSERLGRRLGVGEQGAIAANGSGFWWAGNQLVCGPAGTRSTQRGFVQRLSPRGDTLKAWPLAPAPPNHYGREVLLRGNKVLVAGDDETPGINQARQFSLTCSDTLGNVLWRRLYLHPFTGDYCTGLAALPSRGYLLTGDAYYANGDRRAQLIETDSLGRQRRRVLIQPLGPNYNVSTHYGFNNVVVLPGYGGYVLSGTADSAVAAVPSSPIRVGYVMRLDTALRVQWVYRHPPGFANAGATRSQQAFRVRLLPNGTLAFLLQDVGPFTRDTHLVSLSLGGQRLGHYALSSNAFTTLSPFDWQWVGDGTLVLCGKALAAGTTTPYRAYLARWDLRGTPLTVRQVSSAMASSGGLTAYPNPATNRVQLIAGAGASERVFELWAVSNGRYVGTWPLPSSGRLELDVAGLAAGVYVGRVRQTDGRFGSTCKLVVMQ